MSKEDLLIALLKLNQSHAELRGSEDNSAGKKEIKIIFNRLRNNFSKEEIKKIRRKIYHREEIDEYLKKLEKKDSLTEQGNHQSITKVLQKSETYFKKLKKDLNRLEKHQYNDNEDLDYKGKRQIGNLFNKIYEDYYKPIKTNGTFNDNYM